MIYALYIGGALLVLALISRIPGVDLLLKPFGMVAGDFTRWLAASSGHFSVFIIKAFIKCHVTVISHLLHPEEHFNVELQVKKETEGM